MTPGIRRRKRRRNQPGLPGRDCPHDLRRELANAVVTLETSRVADLTERISELDGSLGELLARCASRSPTPKSFTHSPARKSGERMGTESSLLVDDPESLKLLGGALHSQGYTCGPAATGAGLGDCASSHLILLTFTCPAWTALRRAVASRQTWNADIPGSFEHPGMCRAGTRLVAGRGRFHRQTILEELVARAHALNWACSAPNSKIVWRVNRRAARAVERRCG